MTLVDTSVWVDHLRRGNAALERALLDGDVAMHPFVIGELSCGSLARRDEVLGLLDSLPRAIVADHAEVRRFIEARRLYGRGLGWTDAHLLASAVLSGTALWTMDKALARAASSAGVASGGSIG